MRLETKLTVVPVMVPFTVLTEANKSHHLLSTIHYMQSFITKNRELRLFEVRMF